MEHKIERRNHSHVRNAHMRLKIIHLNPVMELYKTDSILNACVTIIKSSSSNTILGHTAVRKVSGYVLHGVQKGTAQFLEKV